MSVKSYQSDLHQIMRGYWSGFWPRDVFFDLMYAAIDRGLSRAWASGAAKVGIAKDEISGAEQALLSAAIFSEYARIPGLAAFIEQNMRKDGGKLQTVLNRASLWVNRYRDLENRAKVEGEKDPKLRWVLGPTKTHCNTCGKLAGKVKRASWWRDNVMPQQPPNPALECKGWKCGCGLEKTDEPMSRGRMPNVP